ncbi:MAG: oligosaccharide flippase family protein [Gammaproteobacteria bacterium]|nr:oligosaccharide flippase family protein [Alphaproteobacteria bacterium]MBU1444629.1 oligosaccharide flippase family protein [Gammaproteobacteria bacterium]MBU1796722.1 oligosaccharide flippase family protein [Alphaproteobacteria bacterium]|tara:strand:- start:5469 stop:6836 length:1368 start_codon:yes stop_codon:yes gene_type:complete
MRFTLKPDQVSKAAGLLVGGTALGQAIMLLALPFLTRLYTPEDFNTLAIYVAIVGIFSGAICLRFDIAITLPETTADAWRLTILGVVCAAFFSSIIAAGLALLLWSFAINLGIEAHAFSIIVGLGLFSMGAFNSLQMWYVREKSFLCISIVKLLQSIVVVLVQIGIGIWLATMAGLLWGQFANGAVGALALLLILKKNSFPLAILSFKDIKRLFQEYGRFPKYSVFESLANEAASQLPVLLIAFLLGGSEAGFLMLAMRVLQAPIALLGNAISQVFLSQAPLSERNGELAALSKSMLVRLAKIGVGPLIFVGIVAPTIFPVVFGAEWARAGELVSWMTPWFILQLLVSPISMSLHIKGRQDAALELQLVSLVIRVASVVICYLIVPVYMVQIYALSGAATYLIYLIFVCKVLKISLPEGVMMFREAFFLIILCFMAGCLAVASFEQLLPFLIGLK